VPQDWLRACLAAARQLLPACSAHELTLLSWAVARLGGSPGVDWLHALIRAALPRLRSFQPDTFTKVRKPVA
jgi:hypothetical protein